MNIKKIVYLCIGFIGLSIGAIGALIPLLPSFPFLLLAALCFAKSSEKIDAWFKNTNLYKNNLEDYSKAKGMTVKTKVKIMVTVTGLMTIGFIMMNAVPVGQIVLFFVWIAHLIYFSFIVKTIKI